MKKISKKLNDLQDISIPVLRASDHLTKKDIEEVRQHIKRNKARKKRVALA